MAFFTLNINNMAKEKLIKVLTAKCKDMGLSADAIGEIAGFAVAGNGLNDASTDEEIENAANQYLPLAKAMQGEATRWAQKKQEPPTPPTPPAPKPSEAGEMRAMLEELINPLKTTIESQNKTIEGLQAQLAGNERAALIKSEMAKLGLTEEDMEFVPVPSDANVTEFLGKYKQSLVNRGLKPKDTSVSRQEATKANTELADSMLKEFTVGTEQ